MSELKICRICLRTEAKVYHYDQFQLKSYYEEVLAMKVNESENLPCYFCFECAALLHKFHKFKEKCYSGQKVLKEMIMKGPAGIIELLKLSQETSSNTEISSTFSINTTSQEFEVTENPFVETDIDITELPVINNDFSSTGPAEIDSFFIENLDVVLEDERMIENVPLSNICSETPNTFPTYQETNVESDAHISINNNINMNVEKTTENEPIIICEIPSMNPTLLQSDLGCMEINSNPTENLEGIIDSEPSSILYCDLPNMSQEFDETNLALVKTNLDLSTNNNIELNFEKNTENKLTPIVYYELPETSQDFQQPVIEYIETDVEPTNKNNDDCNVGDTEDETLPIIHCELPNTSQELSKTSQKYTNINDDKLKNYNSKQNAEITDAQLSCGFIKSDSISQAHIEHNLNSEENNIQYDQKDIDINSGELPTNGGSSSIFNVSEVIFESKIKQPESFFTNRNESDPTGVTSKNQLTPNLYCVLPTSSQEYFETVPEIKDENVDEEDITLNQLKVEQATVKRLTKNQLREQKRQLRNKRVKPSPCHIKCGNKCSVRLSEVDRLLIHKHYWTMDKQEQQEWLLSCIKPKNIKRRQGATCVKNITYDYFIQHSDKNIKVCQQFLMKTLDISQMRFRYAISKLTALKSAKNEFTSDDSDSDNSYLCSDESA